MWPTSYPLIHFITIVNTPWSLVSIEYNSKPWTLLLIYNNKTAQLHIVNHAFAVKLVFKGFYCLSGIIQVKLSMMQFRNKVAIECQYVLFPIQKFIMIDNFFSLKGLESRLDSFTDKNRNVLALQDAHLNLFLSMKQWRI